MSASAMDSVLGAERRLAAIVVSDVAGYSARMQRDEVGTMALVRADFARMEELAAKEGGEVLNTMGDGMLLGFGSAVQAVTFALQIQAEFAHRRAMKPAEQALEHRIGIHVGEVFRQSGRVAGDGVNIAARLQAKAPVGGISVSQTVHDLVKGKVAVQAVALGPQEFKNIAEKIPVYNLLLPGGAGPVSASPRRGHAGRIAALIAGALLAAAGLWGWKSRTAGSAMEKNSAAAGALVTAVTPVAAEKSIAVLPFENRSENKENAFFTDGIHEDILTNLALIHELHVVSRTSVMEYRGTTKKMRQIGSELGVAYLLEGSVQRSGNKVHVTGQLINARTDEHVWAKNYDRDLTDIFTIQAELARAIVTELQAVLSPQEKARLDRVPTTNTAAYDVYLRARDMLNGLLNVETLDRAASLLQSAVELDPKFAVAWGKLADVHVMISSRTYDPTGKHVEEARLAIETMERLAPDEPETWLQLADYHVLRADYERSESYVRRAAEALPKNGRVVMLQADVERRHGRLTDAVLHYRQAYELDRQNPEIRSSLRKWLMLTRRYAEAADFDRQDSRSNGYTQALLAFYARGSTREMEDWIQAHPVVGWETVMNWKFMIGDTAEFIRLADEQRRRASAGFLNSYHEAQYAAAWFSRGETERARELWTKNLERIREGHQLNSAGVPTMLGFLGRKEEALAALEDYFAQATKLGINRDFINDNLAKLAILSWGGDRPQALAELARLLQVPAGLNVYELRHNPFYKPLQGDPAFEAILNDPKNNAPLL